MNERDDAAEVRRILLVSRYATPLAAAIVGLGVLLTQPRAPLGSICLAIVAGLAAFNWLVVRALTRGGAPSPFWLRARMAVNLGANVALVYMLGPYWTPTWLVLALTPIATAVYSTRRRTLAAGGLFAFLIVGVNVAHGLWSPLDLGQAAAYALFIGVVSLLINSLRA